MTHLVGVISRNRRNLVKLTKEVELTETTDFQPIMQERKADNQRSENILGVNLQMKPDQSHMCTVSVMQKVRISATHFVGYPIATFLTDQCFAQSKWCIGTFLYIQG